jgi:hypothetical protein
MLRQEYGLDLALFTIYLAEGMKVVYHILNARDPEFHFTNAQRWASAFLLPKRRETRTNMTRILTQAACMTV